MKGLFSSKLRVNRRRRSAKERLEAQLVSGVKLARDGQRVPLEDRDIKRISSEIAILDGRIASNQGARWSKTKR